MIEGKAEIRKLLLGVTGSILAGAAMLIMASTASAGIAPSPFAGKSTNMLHDGKPLAQPILQPDLNIRIEVTAERSSQTCQGFVTSETYHVAPGSGVRKTTSNICPPGPKMIETKSITMKVIVKNSGKGTTMANKTIIVGTELIGGASAVTALGMEIFSQLGAGQSKTFSYSRNIADLAAGQYQIKVSLNYNGQTETFYFAQDGANKGPKATPTAGFSISK